MANTTPAPQSARVHVLFSDIDKLISTAIDEAAKDQRRTELDQPVRPELPKLIRAFLVNAGRKPTNVGQPP